MYLRRTQRRRKDGSLVGYLQLAHNHRVEGVTRAEVLLNLGREDELDVEGLRRLMRSIGRYLERADGVGALQEAAGGELRVTDARPLGTAWALDALWRRLGVDRALAQALAGRRHRADVERTIFALVCNRALAPDSKLAAAEWATNDAAIPGLEALEAQHAYRAMDVLASADAEGKVSEAVFFSVADLLTSRSTCSSSTPPRPTSRSRRRTRAATRRRARPCAASATPETTAPTDPRSWSASR